MDPQNGGYFTNLIQSDLHEEQFMMESQYFASNAQVFSKETQVTASMESISKKQPRGANFTIEEDKLLVSAWLNISMDPVQGTDQKKCTFWQKVKDFIDENKPYDTNRTTISLLNRWSTIQLCTNKFCSCYAKIDSLNQSGTNEENKMKNAKDMYKQLNGSAFPFDYCWDILKNQPKWFLECEKKNQLKRPRKGLASSTPCTINLGDEHVAMDNVVDLEQPTEKVVNLERPMGNKAAKMRMKRKNQEITSSTQIYGALVEIKESKKLLVDKKLEMLEKTHDQEEEKIRIKRERLEIDQFKEDERVMMMDLNCMMEEQQEFYRLRKKEILEKRRSN